MPIEDLAWAIEDVRGRLKGYAAARAYDRGEHRLAFATQKYRNTFGDLFREFADNLCDDVVDALADRLQLLSWGATTGSAETGADGQGSTEGGTEAPADTLAAKVDELWTRTSGESRVGGVHRNAICEGDGFAMVQLDQAGQAHIWKQSPDQMAVRWSDDRPDQPEVYAKVWLSRKRYRANLYYPDGTVERYATKGVGQNGGLPQVAAFRPLAAGDPDLAHLGDDAAYVEETGAEGFPVFHYPNGEPGCYGRSVVNKITPLQDALNKSVADMLVAMEFHAYPQRWATGIQSELNADGTEKSPFQAGEGRVWRTGNWQANFGQFDPAQMDGFLKVQDSFRLEIARKGALPPSAINLQSTGSGEPTATGILVAEGRVVKWALDRMRDWGQEHKRMTAYAINLETGAGVLAEDLDPNWAPPQTRDMTALLEELRTKRDVLRVPLKQLMLEAGYDPDQITGFLEEADAETEADQAAALVLTGGRQSATRGQALGLQDVTTGAVA